MSISLLELIPDTFSLSFDVFNSCHSKPFVLSVTFIKYFIQRSFDVLINFKLNIHVIVNARGICILHFGNPT